MPNSRHYTHTHTTPFSALPLRGRKGKKESENKEKGLLHFRWTASGLVKKLWSRPARGHVFPLSVPNARRAEERRKRNKARQR